jgi:hypothetical protein
MGASEGVAETLGRSLPVAMREKYPRTVDGPRAALQEATFVAAWAACKAMTLEQGNSHALEEVPDD